ncbi:hypothetical protein ACFE04_014136 [Oxalis oulophora]
MDGHQSACEKDVSFSFLLELSASDNLIGLKSAVENGGYDVNMPGLWYGRKIGSKKMGIEQRTPLMIAAMYGSKDVLKYILECGSVDVNLTCGSDKATALHCAAAGGSSCLADVVKLLIDASADISCTDAYGNKPSDLIQHGENSILGCKNKALEIIYKIGGNNEETHGFLDDVEGEILVLRAGTEKKEYPVDVTLPDINNGIYGTDDFRMYTFKVKPCSRAYSHDWTECPFVHPGENARRRDPRKYLYSCVPCPEFRKGSCRQGDACEYAHGIFECWLHPAQYRTRLCKDETNCTRRVCFFAHRPEELRPLYASTGSAVPSPRSYSPSDVGALSPLTTPPLTPGVAPSSPGGPMWPSQSTIIPPSLQIPGSRLKAALNARNMNLDRKLLGLENKRRQQQLINELSNLSSTSNWNSMLSMGDWAGELNRLEGVKPNNLDDIFGSSYRNNNLSSSPVRQTPSFGIDVPPPGPSAALSKRSQSFVERAGGNRHPSGFPSPASSSNLLSSCNFSDWGSPDGKLNWGIQGEELNKLRKSASFAFPAVDEPDVSWVQSLVKDNHVPVKSGLFSFDDKKSSTELRHAHPVRLERFYMEQEPLVA